MTPFCFARAAIVSNLPEISASFHVSAFVAALARARPCKPFPTCQDSDDDGWPIGLDNCPAVVNYGQEDGDEDTIGDTCDNCIDVENPDQADSNENGIGDACEEPSIACPCWNQNDVNTVGTLGGEVFCQVRQDANLVWEFNISPNNSGIYAQTGTYSDGGRNCYWRNDDNIAGLSPTSPSVNAIRLDTEEQYAACSAQIAARCADLQPQP